MNLKCKVGDPSQKNAIERSVPTGKKGFGNARELVLYCLIRVLFEICDTFNETYGEESSIFVLSLSLSLSLSLAKQKQKKTEKKEKKRAKMDRKRNRLACKLCFHAVNFSLFFTTIYITCTPC